MSLQKLIVCLEKLVQLHSSLFTLACEKTDVIKKQDMERLQKMVNEEQAHIQAITALEKERNKCAHDFLKTRPNESVTVSDCIAAAAAGEERSKLEALREDLLIIVDKLKKQNDLNQMLIYHSLQYINLTLDLICPKQQPATYAPPQTSRVQAAGISRFDSKA
ncbi:flagellar protein FlgN [Heyndrickxia acidiproducens]|uniref:flagellar protein FlgN n=1 Tax=Heyndrickxia acidiproducens TaxID=1121084 RepID=UPI000371D0A9|nr:flagellar protein FlgN [Heyndrickxia acidiproducens]